MVTFEQCTARWPLSAARPNTRDEINADNFRSWITLRIIKAVVPRLFVVPIFFAPTDAHWYGHHRPRLFLVTIMAYFFYVPPLRPKPHKP